jgi:hypothetical protein
MQKQKRRSYFIVIGGALVVFILVVVFLNSQRSTTQVVVASANIPAGARLVASYLELREVHTNDALPDALTSVDDAAGQVLTIARAPGDQVTANMVGEAATVGVANQLEPGHRAIAIHVNQASGLMGILRPGDRVSIVALVDPQTAQMQQSSDLFIYQPASYEPILEGGSEDEVPIMPQETVNSPAPAAYVTISGLRVLLVPQLFRYEETLPTEDGGTFAPARTSMSAQANGVILLDVPIAAVEIVEGLEMSPAALLPLLDKYADLHLILEPMEGDGVTIEVGAELGDLYRAIVGWEDPLLTSVMTGTIIMPEVPGLDTTAPVTSTESGGD